jgi:hypothetical protein
MFIRRSSVIINSGGLQKELSQDAGKCKDWNHNKNSVGADLLISTRETENHVPRAEHFDLKDVELCHRQSKHERLPVVKVTPYIHFEGVPSNGPWGVQTSTPRATNCGPFWRTWCAERIITWRAWKDPSWRRQKISLETVCAVIAEWLGHPKTCTEAEGGHLEWHHYK